MSDNLDDISYSMNKISDMNTIMHNTLCSNKNDIIQFSNILNDTTKIYLDMIYKKSNYNPSK